MHCLHEYMHCKAYNHIEESQVASAHSLLKQHCSGSCCVCTPVMQRYMCTEAQIKLVLCIHTYVSTMTAWCLHADQICSCIASTNIARCHGCSVTTFIIVFAFSGMTTCMWYACACTPYNMLCDDTLAAARGLFLWLVADACTCAVT